MRPYFTMLAAAGAGGVLLLLPGQPAQAGTPAPVVPAVSFAAADGELAADVVLVKRGGRHGHDGDRFRHRHRDFRGFHGGFRFHHRPHYYSYPYNYPYYYGYPRYYSYGYDPYYRHYRPHGSFGFHWRR